MKNKLKHGITFEQAQGLWEVPAVEVAARTTDEPRYMMIGKLSGKCYSCVFTMRGAVVRLISARRSRKAEEKIYYDHIAR